MLGAIAREAAARFGGRPAVVGPDDTLSYAELSPRADELAVGLMERGVHAGDVVALVLPSGGEWLIAAVACARIGAVAAGVSTAITPSERGELVAMVAPRLVLAGRDLVDGLPLRATVEVLAPGGRGAELAVAGASVPDPAPDDERPAAICFTSGTTGRAKAALYRERQLRAVQRIDLGPDAETIWGGGSPMLASTQFAHIGMTGKMAWYLRLGATLHVMERWRPDDALRLVAEHRMPTIGCVAPQLALMLRSELMDSLDLSCVQAIIAGGGRVATRARDRSEATLRRRVLDPLLVDRVRRRRPRHRVRCARRRGAAHRGQTTPGCRGPHRGRARPSARAGRRRRDCRCAPTPSWTATGTMPTPRPRR